mmetsp:Transcript_9480/g.24450  ORF Transcript_9480/g.24450 Transcript_9480/m.24450 type:complete len:245 (-) Transcript_9480:372-1106(-)
MACHWNAVLATSRARSRWALALNCLRSTPRVSLRNWGSLTAPVRSPWFRLISTSSLAAISLIHRSICSYKGVFVVANLPTGRSTRWAAAASFESSSVAPSVNLATAAWAAAISAAPRLSIPASCCCPAMSCPPVSRSRGSSRLASSSRRFAATFFLTARDSAWCEKRRFGDPPHGRGALLSCIRRSTGTAVAKAAHTASMRSTAATAGCGSSGSQKKYGSFTATRPVESTMGDGRTPTVDVAIT